MKPTLTFIVPGSLAGATGGYEYDRRMVDGLRALGWSVVVRELEGDFPRPGAGALAAAAAVLRAVPDRSLVVVDGLAHGSMPDQIERESSRLRVVGLVHLPLAAEAGLDPDAASRLRTAEQRALMASALVVVTGWPTVAAIKEHGVNEARIRVVEPGTDPAPIARGSSGGPLQLLCVATLNRGKGHAILFRALASLSSDGSVSLPEWRLTCAGSLTRDPATVRQLRNQLRSDGLEDRVTLSGEVGRAALDVLYDGADLFVLPTLHETYGMATAEALAHGIPVIGARTGAAADLAGGDAAILVDPGDEQAFTAALGRAMTDSDLRRRLAGGARRARARLPTWECAVARMNDVLMPLVRDDRLAF